MDQRDNQRTDAPPEPNDRLEQQQFQQQKGRQDDTLSRGQGSASDAGLDASDTMPHADRGPIESTSAQRSGSQAKDDPASGNESSPPDPAVAMFNGEQPADASQDYIDPATDRSSDQGPDSSGDPAKPSDLEGE